MANDFIILSDFGSDVDTEAHNNLWTIEAKQNSDGSPFSSVVGTFTNNPHFVFDAWRQIADFDTFISFNGKHDSQIIQNAIEDGEFRSVNKIRKPNTCTIELAKGGLSEDIQLVLNNLISYKESTALLRVVTPFGIMENLNLIGLEYGFSRENGASMLIAKLQLQEVQSGIKTTKYTLQTTKSPNNTNTQNTGNKAPESPKKEVVNK